MRAASDLGRFNVTPVRSHRPITATSIAMIVIDQTDTTASTQSPR